MPKPKESQSKYQKLNSNWENFFWLSGLEFTGDDPVLVTCEKLIEKRGIEVFRANACRIASHFESGYIYVKVPSLLKMGFKKFVLGVFSFLWAGRNSVAEEAAVVEEMHPKIFLREIQNLGDSSTMTFFEKVIVTLVPASKFWIFPSLVEYQFFGQDSGWVDLSAA